MVRALKFMLKVTFVLRNKYYYAMLNSSTE
jgi:hypothetical protein